MNTIGERIRALRQARRLSQAQVARAAGITPQAVSDIETGKTQNPAYLSELARARMARRISRQLGGYRDQSLTGIARTLVHFVQSLASSKVSQ